MTNLLNGLSPCYFAPSPSFHLALIANEANGLQGSRQTQDNGEVVAQSKRAWSSAAWEEGDAELI